MALTPAHKESGASPDRVLLADATEPFGTTVEVLLRDASYHTPIAGPTWGHDLHVPVILLSARPDVDLKVRGGTRREESLPVERHARRVEAAAHREDRFAAQSPVLDPHAKADLTRLRRRRTRTRQRL